MSENLHFDKYLLSQLQGCESVCEKEFEIIWNAWKILLFNAFKSENGVLWGLRCKKVWNQIKIWTLAPLQLVKLHAQRVLHAGLSSLPRQTVSFMIQSIRQQHTKYVYYHWRTSASICLLRGTLFINIWMNRAPHAYEKKFIHITRLMILPLMCWLSSVFEDFVKKKMHIFITFIIIAQPVSGYWSWVWYFLLVWKLVQWNLVIKRPDITKPSSNKVILLVPPLYIFVFSPWYEKPDINKVIFMVPRTSL